MVEAADPAARRAPLRPDQPQPPLPTEIPPSVAQILRRALAAELEATRAGRRQAFRVTRTLLGGARQVGYPALELVRDLDISVHSVRTRGGSDGWISVASVIDLADLTPGTVAGWHRDGLLPPPTTDASGQVCCRASDVIRALAGSS
jgi:hypothetical protein